MRFMINLKTVVEEYTVTVNAKVALKPDEDKSIPHAMQNTVMYVAMTPFRGVNEAGQIKDVLLSSEPAISIEGAIQDLVNKLTFLEDEYPKKPIPSWEITD